MKPLLAALALSLSCGALAQTSVGVHGSLFTRGLGQHLEGGLHVMSTRTATFRLLGTNTYRTTLEGNFSRAASGPNVLPDASPVWPTAGRSYFGAGIGSGVAFPKDTNSGLPFPAFVLTPIALANVHGFYGTRLDSGTMLEGVLRLRPASEGVSLGARVSFPLR